MTTSTTLGPKPKGSEISFAPDCFKENGTRDVWIVSNPTGWGYPARFYDEAEASKVAKNKNHALTKSSEVVSIRVKWN